MKDEDAFEGAKVVVTNNGNLQGKHGVIINIHRMWPGNTLCGDLYMEGMVRNCFPVEYLELVSQSSVTKELKYQENPTCTECGIPNNYAEVLVGAKYTCRACVLRRSAY